jgi:hypothetical protein
MALRAMAGDSPRTWLRGPRSEGQALEFSAAGSEGALAELKTVDSSLSGVPRLARGTRLPLWLACSERRQNA